MNDKKCAYCNQIKNIKDFIFTKNEWRKPRLFVCKDCGKSIDPMDFKNIIKLCEDLDIPLLLDVYLDLYEYKMARNNSFNFLTYISKTRLAGFRGYNFKDSICYNTNVEQYKIEKLRNLDK